MANWLPKQVGRWIKWVVGFLRFRIENLSGHHGQDRVEGHGLMAQSVVGGFASVDTESRDRNRRLSGCLPGQHLLRRLVKALDHAPSTGSGQVSRARQEHWSRSSTSSAQAASLSPLGSAGPVSLPSCPGLLSNLARIAVRLALAALLFSGAGPVPATASAEVLVGNVGQLQEGKREYFNQYDIAQRLSTDNEARRYTRSSAEFQIFTNDNSGTTPPIVKVYSGLANGAEVALLSGPARLEAYLCKTRTFTASGTVTRNASIGDWVVAEILLAEFVTLMSVHAIVHPASIPAS